MDRLARSSLESIRQAPHRAADVAQAEAKGRRLRNWPVQASSGLPLKIRRDCSTFKSGGNRVRAVIERAESGRFAMPVTMFSGLCERLMVQARGKQGRIVLFVLGSSSGGFAESGRLASATLSWPAIDRSDEVRTSLSQQVFVISALPSCGSKCSARA